MSETNFQNTSICIENEMQDLLTKKCILCPRVNINGTGVMDLKNQQIKIYEACENLLRALQVAMPHGRDFQYEDGQVHLDLARKQHRERMRRVSLIQEEALATVNNISSQQGEV